MILLSEMGSLVLAYPMFRRIRELYPGATVHVLTFRKNLGILEILDVAAAGDILTIDDSSPLRLARDTVTAVSRMRKIHIDAAVDCELFARVSSILSFLSGARFRAGFHPHAQEGLYRGDFINRPVVYNPHVHISHQFLSLVEALDSDTFPRAKRPIGRGRLPIPSVAFGADEILTAKLQLYAHAPQIAGRQLVLIHPGGGVLSVRAWPLSHYCSLAERLLEADYAVGIIGTKEDRSLAAQITSHCGDPCCVDLTGYTKTVRHLIKIFNIASLLITSDGGPAQLAAMTPVASIVFFGPESPHLYGSLNPNCTVLYRAVSCSPCLTAYNHRKSACDGDNMCLKLITPEMVLDRALEILRRGKPRQEAETKAAAQSRS